MKISAKLIEEIAGNLECGMLCYLHKHTGELKTIINEDSYIDADMELWQEAIDEIESNRGDYIEIEGMDSHESFRVMSDFASGVDNMELQDKLFDVLNRPKPFSNFKWIIDNSGDYRQAWFDFKRRRYIDYVKEQIDMLDEE